MKCINNCNTLTNGASKKMNKKYWFKVYSGVHRKQLDNSESYSLNKHLWLLVNIKYANIDLKEIHVKIILYIFTMYVKHLLS